MTISYYVGINVFVNPRQWRPAMRFMMLMIPNMKDGNRMPSPERVAAMAKFNEPMTKAGGRQHD
ncbi:MAG: hypothetical protein KGL26_01000 [Pseudomonadota bacterium]|nr:hypothetical protein [Pseudomonadota bacterium]